MKSIFNKLIDLTIDKDSLNNYKALHQDVNFKISTLMYIGFSKKAPGTVASFVTVLFFFILSFIFGSYTNYIVLILIIPAILAAYRSIDGTVTKLDSEGLPSKDPKFIVIDEVAGQMVPLLIIDNSNITYMIIAFVLFRIFDITKISLVGYAERIDEPKKAILLDDIVAGCFALFVLIIFIVFIM